MPADIMFLFAKWNLVTYSISYQLNGGTLALANPTSYTYETSTIALTNPTRLGYSFSGWYKDPLFNFGPNNFILKNTTGNLTFYPKWEIIPVPEILPLTVYYIQDGLTGVAVDSILIIAFSEPVRNLDNSILSNEDLSGLINLTDLNNDLAVPFTATINADKTQIFITPANNLLYNTNYSYSILDNVEGISNNRVLSSSGTFRTIASLTPIVTPSTPQDTPNPNDFIIDILNTNFVLTFNKPVRMLDGTIIAEANLADVVKLTLADGVTNVASTISINSEKSVITINPNSDLLISNQYLLTLIALEDYNGNQMSEGKEYQYFTSPIVTFTPSNNTLDVAVNNDITITFSSAIRKIDDSAFSATDVSSLIEVRIGSLNATPLASSNYVATFSNNNTIRIDPNTNLPFNTDIYVTLKGGIVEYLDDATIGLHIVKFRTITNSAQQITFAPINNTTGVSIDTTNQIVITFNEGVRLVNNTLITTTNIKQFIQFKQTDSSGVDVAYTVLSITNNRIVTLVPNTTLLSNQLYYLGVLTGLETIANEEPILPESSTFTTAAAVSVINPTTSGLTIRFNARVRYESNAGLNTQNINNPSLIVLRLKSDPSVIISNTLALATNNTELILTGVSLTPGATYEISFREPLEYQASLLLVPFTSSGEWTEFTVPNP
jgi:uncharacterized repeat protein (TIGR02543 family)